MSASPPIRLVFLIRDLGHGGAQRQLVTLARSLARREDFEVSVVHFYPGAFDEDLRAAGVRTCCVGKKHRWDLAGFCFRLIRTLRALRPEVVHGYLHESNLMALLLRPLCRFPRVLWGIRDSQTDAATWGLLGRLSFRLNCLLSGGADCIIANSRAGRDYYIAQGYPVESFTVVPNGIDVERFHPRPKAGPGGVFAVIGRLHPMKDHATFLRALAAVPEARGVILGSGGAAYADELKALAAALGITHRLEWQEARDDLAAIYPDLDAVVSTSAYGEGFSNVLGEAMACGRPVIASDVGDSAWLVNDPRWVFPAGDHAALAAKMRALLALGAEGQQELGQRNRQRIEAHFTIAKMVETTGALCAAQARESQAARKHVSAVSARVGAKPQPAAPARVLWVTTGLGTGGAEMMLTQLITGLTACGGVRHHVISLTSGGKHVDSLRAVGAEVHSLDMPAGKPTLRALLRLMRLSWQIRPQVVMGWMYHGCLVAVLVKLFRFGRGRVVWNIRQSLYDLRLEKRGSAQVIRALAWLAPLVDKITYNSRLSARQHEAIGYSPGRTKLVPNGFDLKKWHGLVSEGQDVGARSVEPLRIGRFGRYTAMKDYPGFLAAAAKISPRLPQAEFLLAGTGVDEANEELTQLVEDLGLRGRVKLLGERHDLPELTASLDLAVSSSAFGEGFPNVVGEAMTAGVPVVATDIGDTAWVMGDTGRLVPAKDPEALAAACLEILSLPPEERLELGKRGRQRIEEHFSLEHALTEFDSLLRTH